MTKKRNRKSWAKRSTYITPRASGYALPSKDYWPSTHLSPIKRYVVKSYIPPSYPIYRERQRPARRALTPRPRGPVSGMHDTRFKRPQIDSYGAWGKTLGYLLPPAVKVCVQRKQRREAIFATNGGGSMRRKSTNRRTLRSEIRCK